MCGGPTCRWAVPKHLYLYEGKHIVERTVGLLQDYGVEDIAITTSPAWAETYEKFGVEVISYDASGAWVNAFYPTDEPVCYMMGDVVYSPEAIKKIVDTETSSIEFFASAPPFAREYPKPYAEPFAFKVVNQKRFRECIEKTKELNRAGVWYRHPGSWELWQIIKGTSINRIDYTNYVVINDYTCDVDYESELDQWQNT